MQLSSFLGRSSKAPWIVHLVERRQKALMQLLLQQEAESLIESRNNTSTVQVLDPALPPELKARPQRMLYVFITGVLSLFSTIAFTLGAVYFSHLRERWLNERVAQV